MIGRLKEFQAGLGITEIFLIAQRKYTDALLNERLAACQYNTSLAEFQRQRGTILDYDSITIAEGPLPVGVQERANRHRHARSQALVLRQAPQRPSCPTQEPPALQDVLPGEAPESEAGPQPELERLPLPKLLDQPPLPKMLPN